MASVSLSLLMASCGDAPDRDRCLDLELDPELELGLELDELDELTLKIFEILLIFSEAIACNSLVKKNPTCLKLQFLEGSREILLFCFSDSIQNTNVTLPEIQHLSAGKLLNNSL